MSDDQRTPAGTARVNSERFDTELAAVWYAARLRGAIDRGEAGVPTSRTAPAAAEPAAPTDPAAPVPEQA